MSEIEDIADTSVLTIDELLKSLLRQCTQNSFNENYTIPQFSSEKPFTNHVWQLQMIDPELTIGLCSIKLSDPTEIFTNECLNK